MAAGTPLLRVGEILQELEQAKYVAQQNLLTNWAKLQEALKNVNELVVGEGVLEVSAPQKATLKARVEAMIASLKTVAETLHVTLPE